MYSNICLRFVHSDMTTCNIKGLKSLKRKLKYWLSCSSSPKLIRTEKSHTFGTVLHFPEFSVWLKQKSSELRSRVIFSPFGILSCSAQAVFPRSSLLFQQLLLSVSFLLLFSLCLSRLREGAKRRIMLFGWSFYFLFNISRSWLKSERWHFSSEIQNNNWRKKSRDSSD